MRQTYKWVRSPEEQANRDSLASFYRAHRREGLIGRIWAQHCWKVKDKIKGEIWDAYMGQDLCR